jgi:hypothetical protein
MAILVPEPRPLLDKAKEQLKDVRNIRTRITLADVVLAALTGTLTTMARRVHIRRAPFNGHHEQIQNPDS